MTPFDIGLIAGLVWASVLVVWALADMTSGETSPLLILVSCIYEGFDFSPRGLCVGAGWAFADGFISGYLISFLVSFIF